jgi:CRP/FNR family cyclic AMP-dependent transcriptional regulator
MSAVAEEVLFDLLSPDAQQWLASQGQRKSYDDGTLIHNRGDTEATMGIVIAGQVRLFQIHPNGSHTFVSMIQTGAHYGDILLFYGKQRTHDAMAIGPTAVDHYNPAAFAKLMENNEIVQALYKISLRRLGRAMAMSDDLRVLSRDAHLAKVLLNQWRQRGKSDWIVAVQEDLAGMIGVTTMTLSKSLTRMRDEGLIETGYRKIRVVDADALKAWLKGRITG